MRWRRHEQAEQPSRADEALERSQRQLEEARRQRRHWEEFAARLRRMREENHLAEAFERAFGEGR